MRIVTVVQGQNVSIEIGGNQAVVVVGRLRECDLVVKNPSVSRRHCKFTFKNGMVEVEDLGSSSGTWVNGERVDTAIVDSSDTIKIGNQELRLEGGAAAPSSASAPSGAASDFDKYFSSEATPDPDAHAAGGAMVDPDAGPKKSRDPLDDIDFSLPSGGRRRRGSKESRSESSGPSRSGGRADAAAGSSASRSTGGASGGASGDASSSRREGASSASDGMWELVWEDGGEKWPIHPSDPPKSVGRKEGVDILIPNPTVGRKHATVGFDGDKLQVVDLKSSNGTYINGKRIRSAYVKDGDVVGFGSAEAKVVCRAGGGGLPEPIDDWDEWGEDDWGDDDFEMQPPSWHLVWLDQDGKVSSLLMSLTNRVLAVGSARDCEISVPGAADLDPEHAEMTWDQGALVVRDLGSSHGVQVNGRTVDDEQVLRNQDVVKCGDVRVQIIRGTQGQPARTPTTEGFEFWEPALAKRDDALSLTYIEYDADNPERRREMTIWGDGMGSVEKFEKNHRSSLDGQASQTILEPLCQALVSAGFPEAPSDNAQDGEEPPELECEFDGESAFVALTKKTCGKSEHYSEALELLRAIIHAWDPVG